MCPWSLVADGQIYVVSPRAGKFRPEFLATRYRRWEAGGRSADVRLSRRTPLKSICKKERAKCGFAVGNIARAKVFRRRRSGPKLGLLWRGTPGHFIIYQYANGQSE